MQKDLKSLSPQQVKDILYRKDDSYLLIDIRDMYEFNDWNIKGSINVPVNNFIASGNLESIKSAFSKLNRNKKLIISCLRGINSQLAAMILQDMGYKAYILQNGMLGWNENFDIYEIPLNSAKNTAFSVVQFNRIGKGCLSYIIIDENTKESAIIDPSIFTDEYLYYINGHNLKVKYVIDTHSHADHFSGAMMLAKTLGVDYNINKIDMDSVDGIKDFENISDLCLGKLHISVHSTPGHTDGSMSFFIGEKALICGDLLLPESVGRPDLARSNADTIKGAENLYNSINSFILKLKNDVLVFPAHYSTFDKRPVTLSIEELKQHNDSLIIADKQEFVNYITSNMPKTPPNYLAIKKFNKSATLMPMDYAEDLEIGPNRCSSS